LLLRDGEPRGEDGSANAILLVVGELVPEGLDGMAVLELPESESDRDCMSEGDVADGSAGDFVAIVTIFTPFALSLTAGMKSVVLWFASLTEMRSGWFEEQQPLSSEVVAVL